MLENVVQDKQGPDNDLENEMDKQQICDVKRHMRVCLRRSVVVFVGCMEGC